MVELMIILAVLIEMIRKTKKMKKMVKKVERVSNKQCVVMLYESISQINSEYTCLGVILTPYNTCTLYI